MLKSVELARSLFLWGVVSSNGAISLWAFFLIYLTPGEERISSCFSLYFFEFLAMSWYGWWEEVVSAIRGCFLGISVIVAFKSHLLMLWLLIRAEGESGLVVIISAGRVEYMLLRDLFWFTVLNWGAVEDLNFSISVSYGSWKFWASFCELGV